MLEGSACFGTSRDQSGDLTVWGVFSRYPLPQVDVVSHESDSGVDVVHSPMFWYPRMSRHLRMVQFWSREYFNDFQTYKGSIEMHLSNLNLPKSFICTSVNPSESYRRTYFSIEEWLGCGR